ncbi:hypothetical protein D9V34_15600 [Mycetocola lacteus]|uniref:YcxB family protein n=1 Tax=Mycetocola lacteus TaxID=76637 RepID=A0A3L7AFJ6_9MICO|nr:hypothetical protein [Mycetocola lacteus]RLP79226.1 hypothetical protein D9V34_15600 [Mycetocola lacteus]
MYDSSIRIGPEDRANARRALTDTYISRALQVSALIVLPLALLLTGLMLIFTPSGVGFTVLGMILAMTALCAWAMGTLRRRVRHVIDVGWPEEAPLRLHINPRMLTIDGPFTTSALPQDAITAVTRRHGTVVIRCTAERTVFILPERMLSEDALALIGTPRAA